jgi:hypothetical protein
MRIQRRSYYILLIALLACSGILLSQQSSADTVIAQNVRGGLWESVEPDGTVAGIDLAGIPASVPDAVYPEETPRPKDLRIQIGVFHGNSQTAHRAENFFETGWTGPGSEYGSATYENQKLEVNYHDPRFGLDIQLELVFEPAKDEWTGRFHRGSFDRQVTLRRHPPQPGPVAPTMLLASTGTPGLFRVEMRNPSIQDLMLYLGIEVGANQYPEAVRYTLTAPDGRVLHLESTEPGVIAGRVDPLVVPLPAGATFSFLVDLNEYAAPKEKILQLDLLPGRYTLQAEYTGEAVPQWQADPNFQGIALMHFWVGTVTSAPLAFTVGNGGSSPRH